MLEFAFHIMVNGYKKYSEVVLQIIPFDHSLLILLLSFIFIELKHMNVHVCTSYVCWVGEGDSQEHCGI